MPVELLNCDCRKKSYWTGRKHTEETKQKMREARLKNQPMHNPEVVAKRSATLVEQGTFAKENNNTWKGGITKASILARNSKKSIQWREDVFLRDNYTCQKCNKRCGNGSNVVLNAHHIKPFSKYPERRLDVNNGITLCVDCHRKEHSNG